MVYPSYPRGIRGVVCDYSENVRLSLASATKKDREDVPKRTQRVQFCDGTIYVLVGRMRATR